MDLQALMPCILGLAIEILGLLFRFVRTVCFVFTCAMGSECRGFAYMLRPLTRGSLQALQCSGMWAASGLCWHFAGTVNLSRQSVSKTQAAAIIIA